MGEGAGDGAGAGVGDGPAGDLLSLHATVTNAANNDARTIEALDFMTNFLFLFDATSFAELRGVTRRVAREVDGRLIGDALPRCVGRCYSIA